MKVKTSVGEFDIGTLTWKQIKEANIYTLIKKISSSDSDVSLESLDDNEIDRVVRTVAGDKTDEMTFEDVLEIFSAVIEKVFNTKK